MHSKRPESGQRQPYGGRDRRRRDEYNDRQEDRHEYHRDVQWDSYHNPSRSGPGRTERSGRSTDYGDSPQKLYSKDSQVRDGDRRSPVRGRLSSPDRRVAEKNRRRFTDDSRNDYTYGCEPDGKKYRQSPDSLPKDLKHLLPQEVRRSMQDSRSQHRPEEFTSRYHEPYDSSHRQQSTYNRDHHEGHHSYSLERKLPKEDSEKRYVKPSERKNGSPTDRTDRVRNYMYLDSSKRQSFEHVTKPSQDVPQKKFANGFQRFLDVLNKGVDVDVLNQIVIQSPAQGCAQPPSASSSHNAVGHPYFPGEQAGQLHVSQWNEEKFGQDCHRLPFPQQSLGSFSSERSSPYGHMSVQRSDGGHGYTRSMISPVVEKKRLTPADEHKHQHMQEVLQAIGVDLGSEELGQMSHRINERLYGKKESDRSCQSTGSGERVTRSAYFPKSNSRSRSSSSSSSRTKATCTDYSVHRDSYNAKSNFKVAQVSVPHTVSSSRALLDGQKCEIQATVPPNSNVATLRPTTPAYGRVNTSQMLFPPLLPNISNVGPRLLFPPLPSLPHQSPLHQLARRLPFMPYPCPSPLNILPAVLAQTRHLFPPPMNNIQLPFLNLPNVPLPLPSVGTLTKSKMLPRPRCLQVIDTKQPI